MKFSVLKIDAEEYRLAYDFNEICDAESFVGCNLLLAVERLGEGISASQLRGLLFAAIRAVPYDGMPKPVELLKLCGQLIRIDTMSDIISALGESFALAVSEEYAAAYRSKVAELREPKEAPAPAVQE